MQAQISRSQRRTAPHKEYCKSPSHIFSLCAGTLFFSNKQRDGDKGEVGENGTYRYNVERMKPAHTKSTCDMIPLYKV